MNGRIIDGGEEGSRDGIPQSWIDNLMLSLRDYPVYAKVLVNSNPTQVEVKFRGLYTEMRNLQEFPLFVSLLLQPQTHQSQYENPFETPGLPQYIAKESEDGREWHEIDDKEISEGLQIYCLYNPSFILPKVKFKLVHGIVPTVIEGEYSIESLSIPETVKEFFKDNNELIRTVRITHHNNHLVNMTQKDFPPFNDQITLEFLPS